MTEFTHDHQPEFSEVESRIADDTSPLARDLHVRQVVYELDEGDMAPLWHPQTEYIGRDQLERVVGGVMQAIVDNWYELRPEMLPDVRTPEIDKAAQELMGRSQSRFSHPTLARLAISSDHQEKVIKQYPNVIPESLRHFEVGAAVYRGRKTPVFSSLGLLAFARPNARSYNQNGTRMNMTIVRSTGAMELRAKNGEAAVKAARLELARARKPIQGGLPGTGKHS